MAGSPSVGRKVTVHFNANAPEQAVLERAKGSWLLIGSGALWAALGALWLIYDRNVTRRGSDNQ
jgi:hypothetical protein